MFTTGNWMVKKGNEQEFIDTWKAFADYTNKNIPGWRGYAYLLRDAGNPSRFLSFGEWKDTESVKSWSQTPEFKSFMQRFDALCESHQITSMETVARIGQLEAVTK